MHICYHTNEYPKHGFAHGGIGSFVKRIAENLSKRGVRVTIINLGYSLDLNEKEENGLLTIYYLKRSKWPLLKFVDHKKALNRTVRLVHSQHPIDIIESQENGLASLIKIPEITYLIRMHGGHHYFAEAENRSLEWKKVMREKKSFSKADELVSVSNYTNVRTAHFLGFNPALTTIIPNGVDLSYFKPAAYVELKPRRIVFAGMVCEKKGIRQLIMAMPEVRAKFPDVELIVLGNLHTIDKNTGGWYVDYLQTFIEPSVKEAVKLIGFVDSEALKKWVYSAEICVYPSHMEALPFAWVEVLAMQKLLIGGDAGPAKEVIDDNITGMLCNPHEPADIASKIIYAFENPKQMEQIAKNGRLSAINKFDNEKLYQMNLDFYQLLIDKKKQKPQV